MEFHAWRRRKRPGGPSPPPSQQMRKDPAQAPAGQIPAPWPSDASGLSRSPWSSWTRHWKTGKALCERSAFSGQTLKIPFPERSFL